MAAPVSVLILTYNEEVNLPYALESVAGWAGQIVVVDSYSSDRTVEIAQSYGADVYQHAFESTCAQRNWSIKNPSFKYEWVLYIDADEQVTPQLREEIAHILPVVPDEVAGFLMRRRFVFMGRWLRYGGNYKWLLRLFRWNRCHFVEVGVLEYPVVQGQVQRLKSDLIHHDRKSLSAWIQKQNSVSTKAALRRVEPEPHPARFLNSKEERVEGRLRACLNGLMSSRFPAIAEPFARFFWHYFFQLGFLDGWEGFAYSFLLEFWYPLVVGLKERELRSNPTILQEAREALWR